MLGLKYTYFVNHDRVHGFKLPLKSVKGYLIISADFSITEEEMKELVDNNTVVLATDHHEIQRNFIDIKGSTAEGIVINNQYPFEPEEDKYLSGAGVFYELICSLYPDFINSERKALVGITLLSDIRQIENKKAEAYLKSTYTADTSQGYIKYLIDCVLERDYSFGTPKLDRNFIDFTLNPSINALLRADKTDDAVNFILGGGLASNEQRETQKNLQAIVSSRMTVLELPNIHIIAINALDFIDYNFKLPNYVGLICSNYKDSHKGISTLGFVFENGKLLRTSFRGKFDDIMYLSGFRNLGIDAKGHHNAFGIPEFYPTEETWIQLNDLIGDLEAMHQTTIKIVESSNLMITLTNSGSKMATKNCYVRDMYRYYIKYTGHNAKVVKTTFRYEPFTDEDYHNGLNPDKVDKGTYYKLLRDKDNNPIPKYIEYLIDGRTVKSFGVSLDNGFIMPILEKGYMQLYIRSPLQ